jgi:hypothetical protein
MLCRHLIPTAAQRVALAFTRAVPVPDTTKSHWSAPRWRLRAPPSESPGAIVIHAACERALPSAIRKPFPKRKCLRCMPRPVCA